MSLVRIEEVSTDVSEQGDKVGALDPPALLHEEPPIDDLPKGAQQPGTECLQDKPDFIECLLANISEGGIKHLFTSQKINFDFIQILFSSYTFNVMESFRSLKFQSGQTRMRSP